MWNERIYTWWGERIDARLSKEYALSRSFFHHLLERQAVRVNNKIVKKSYQLHKGDTIEIENRERFLNAECLGECPNIEIPILQETEEYLILNKPKGVLTHPRTMRDLHEPSVSGFLYHHYKNLPSLGNFIRAGILHRLDKMTDGILLVAKTEQALAHFKQLFETRTWIRKRYRATSHITSIGKQFLEKIQNNLPFLIDELVIPKIPHAVPKQGQTKIISFTIRGDLVDLSLEILTGRTHQIRYHLSQHGLPIVGDYLYGKDEGIDMQLTAWKLEFLDTKGEMQKVEI